MTRAATHATGTYVATRTYTQPTAYPRGTMESTYASPPYVGRRRYVPSDLNPRDPAEIATPQTRRWRAILMAAPSQPSNPFHVEGLSSRPPGSSKNAGCARRRVTIRD